MAGPDWNSLYQEVLKNPGSRHFVTVAEGLFRDERLDEAEAVCSRGLSAHPTQSRGLTLMAEILRAKGKMAEAKTTLERVLRVDPENVKINIRMGEFLEEMNDFEGAQKFFGIASIFSPDNEYLQEKLKVLENRKEAAEDTAPAFGEPNIAEKVDPARRSGSLGDETLPSAGVISVDSQEQDLAEDKTQEEPDTSADGPVLPEETEQEAPADGGIAIIGMEDTPVRKPVAEIQEIDADNLMEVVPPQGEEPPENIEASAQEDSSQEILSTQPMAALESPEEEDSFAGLSEDSFATPVIEEQMQEKAPVESLDVPVREETDLLGTESGEGSPLLEGESSEDGDLLAAGSVGFQDVSLEEQDLGADGEEEEAAAANLTAMLDLAEEEQRALFPQGEDGEEITTLSLGRLYARRGNKEKAAEIFRRLLLKDPGNFEVRQALDSLEAGTPSETQKTSINPFPKVAELEEKEKMVQAETRMKREKVDHLRSWLKRVKGDENHVS